MAQQEPPTPFGQRFGAYVRQLRTARRMLVQQLAENMGADRGRVWECERGHIPKRRATLDRLADAFTPPLSAHERRQLYQLAGYQVHVSDPRAEDFTVVADELRDQWLSASHPPIVVSDLTWKIWFANEAFARLFTTVAPAEIAGRHMVEVFFDPHFGLRHALGRLAEDREITTFLHTMLARCRRNHLHALTEPWCRTLIERMNPFEEFATAWKAVSRTASAAEGGLSALHCLNVRPGGRLVVHAVASRRDPRFFLALFLPTNVQAARIIEQTLATL
jgi:transcriptional regulator with XRE-family HTH domain